MSFIGFWAKLLRFGRSKRAYHPERIINRPHGMKHDLPDERDQLYGIRLFGDVSIPSSASCLSFASGVKTQDPLNSCVAHALGLCYEMEMRNVNKTEVDCSELQLYYDGRNLGGLLPNDEGMYPRDCLKVMQKQGIAPEVLWPYDYSQVNTKPSMSGVFKAIPLSLESFENLLKIKSYHAVSNDAVRQELAQNHPVAVGIPIYQEFDLAGSDHRTPVTGVPRGYHEIAIIAYDDDHQNLDGSQGAYFIQNSWGTSWGQNGRTWIPYNFFTSSLPNNNQPFQFYSIRV